MAINKLKTGMLEWYIEQEFPGLLRIEPMGGDYARGDTGEDGLYFHDEADAVRQLLHLVGILQKRVSPEPKCIGCQTTLLLGNKICPKCGLDNTDQ